MRGHKHTPQGPQNNVLIFHMDEVDRRDNEKHDAFVILEGNVRGEYEFTVLLLLSGAIKYIPPKQQICHVEYNS